MIIFDTRIRILNLNSGVLTIYMEKPEIPVGKSNGTHHSIWSTYMYIRLLTTSPKGLFSANYKEKDKNKNIYKLFKVTIANH